MLNMQTNQVILPNITSAASNKKRLVKILRHESSLTPEQLRKRKLARMIFSIGFER